jgi:hypothetical protein
MRKPINVFFPYSIDEYKNKLVKIKLSSIIKRREPTFLIEEDF